MGTRRTKAPDRNAAARRKLAKTKQMSTAEVKKAMVEASKAIDHLTGEVSSLKQIIIAERAQVIYYTEQALRFSRRENLEIALKQFNDLPEDEQHRLIVRAMQELQGPEGPVPHDAPANGEKKPAHKLEIVQ